MAAWLDNGLPRPENVYPFEDDAGLSRTPQDTGIHEQEQKWLEPWRTYTLEFKLTGAQLENAEDFIRDFGYAWFDMPLISDHQRPESCPPTQEVRIISAAPRFTFDSYNRVTLAFDVEAKPPPEYPMRVSQFLVQFAGKFPLRESQFLVEFAGKYPVLSTQFVVEAAYITSEYEAG